MIEAKTPLVGLNPLAYCQQSAEQKVLVQGNVEYKERGSRKENIRTERQKNVRCRIPAGD